MADISPLERPRVATRCDSNKPMSTVSLGKAKLLALELNYANQKHLHQINSSGEEPSTPNSSLVFITLFPPPPLSSRQSAGLAEGKETERNSELLTYVAQAGCEPHVFASLSAASRVLSRRM